MVSKEIKQHPNYACIGWDESAAEIMEKCIKRDGYFVKQQRYLC